MKENFDTALQEKMAALCQEMLDNLAKDNPKNYQELMAAWRELHSVYTAVTAQNLQQWAEQYEQLNAEGANVDILEANEAVVEFWDKNTGKLFRRTLPINCMETANGIVLAGETMDGQPAKIAFLSESAMQKIHDLMGKGPDAPHHDDHKH